jgi:transcriptional regulator with XRE-family HTH domain
MRMRRHLTAAQVAERAGCSVRTISNIEDGAPSVAIGWYYRVLRVYQMENQITLIGEQDPIGQQLEESQSKEPKRIRHKRSYYER